MEYRGTVINVYSNPTGMKYTGPGFTVSNGEQAFYVASSTYGVAFAPNPMDAQKIMQGMIDRYLDS